jgi:aspartate aminotransferase-like enzyme
MACKKRCTCCCARKACKTYLRGISAGHSADGLRKVILERFDMPLGTGLGKLQDKVFRIGHLGDFNDLMLAGTLGGVEMGLEIAGVPHRKGGVAAGLDYLTESLKVEHAVAR